MKVEDTANLQAEKARRNHTALTKLFNDRRDWNTKRLALTRHGPMPTVVELTERIGRDEKEQTRLAAEATAEAEKKVAAEKDRRRFDSDREKAEEQCVKFSAKLREVESAHDKAETRRETVAGTLSGDWATRWETLTIADVTALADEEQALRSSGVAEQVGKLQEEATLRADWEQRRDKAQADIAALPADARVNEAMAVTAATVARSAAIEATTTRDLAKHEFDDQTSRIERRADLVEKVKQAETAARVHATLYRHLGADGLLRDLVRSAERQIVRFANETVSNLSEGDLTIELDDAEDGPDKAFTLKVRRAEDATPIGVNYLSGSQKFRVSVSVALGIGRFATSGTQARPLECVIIDEGFGSLDKDGLRSTADKLNRLKQYLKRIILVSHQDEFTDHFPVVIRLSKGENGTTVDPIRR